MDDLSRQAGAPLRSALIADDDHAFRLLLQSALSRFGFEVTAVSDGLAALERALARQYDLVVLDVLMPGADGYEVCRALRALPGYRLTPILMATGLEDDVSIGRAFEAGASDFERKPLKLSLLSHRIMFLLKASEDLRELEEKRTALEFQATHDTLTGLPNRAGLANQLPGRLARDASQGRSTGVLYIDLEGFRNVNDAMGHPFGDRLLRSVVDRLRSATPEGGLLARIGGDEFALAVSGIAGQEEAEAIARALLSALQAPIRLDHYEFPIGASIGICLASGNEDTIDLLIQNADLAMVRAKRQGRRKFSVYDEKLTLARLDRQALQSELRHAIARDELVLLYQPQVELATGHIRAAEALLRWRHPIRGLLEPDVFIPIAEASGVMADIGHWVLERAARQAARWCRPPFGLEFVSVNLSGPEVWRSDFARHVRDLLTRADVEPGMIQLELSETLAVDPSSRAETLDALKSLHSFGLNFAIDDFGTGHSSIQEIEKIQASALKLDVSFVHGLTRGGADQAVVRAIIALADNLGLRLIAEGVETAEQAQWLAEAGCEQGQGYLFSRPVEADRFEALLDANSPSARAALAPVPKDR